MHLLFTAGKDTRLSGPTVNDTCNFIGLTTQKRLRKEYQKKAKDDKTRQDKAEKMA